MAAAATGGTAEERDSGRRVGADEGDAGGVSPRGGAQVGRRPGGGVPLGPAGRGGRDGGVLAARNVCRPERSEGSVPALKQPLTIRETDPSLALGMTGGQLGV